MAKEFKGKSKDPFINEFFEEIYTNGCPDGMQEVQEVIRKRHEDNDKYNFDSLADDAIAFLEIGDWDSWDEDFEHDSEMRGGKTEVADGIFAEWEYCHGEYFGNAEAWDTFYPEGDISFSTAEDIKKEQSAAADKYWERFSKENPDITVEEAVKKVFTEFNNK